MSLIKANILTRSRRAGIPEPAGRSRAGQQKSGEILVVEVIVFHAHAELRALPFSHAYALGCVSQLPRDCSVSVVPWFSGSVRLILWRNSRFDPPAKLSKDHCRRYLFTGKV